MHSETYILSLLSAYSYLANMVETTVSKFLNKQEEWTPELNKNHLREKLRRNIIELNFLEAGVERIVNQVVDPKISTVFQPNIEEMVYNHLGIEQPKVEILQPPGLSELSLENVVSKPPPAIPEATVTQSPLLTSRDTSNMSIDDPDLLPTDLEAVSPDSNRSASGPIKVETEHSEVKEEVQVKREEVEMEMHSPYYAIQVRPATVPPEKCLVRTESQESNISGLTSQDSIESEHDRKDPTEITVAAPLESTQEVVKIFKEETKTVESSAEAAKEDSQLSQVSSDTQSSVKFDQLNRSAEEPLKMDISEEAQMPSRFPEPQRNERNEVLTTFAGLQKEAITFEQAKRDEEELPLSEEKAETDSQASSMEAQVLQNKAGEDREENAKVTVPPSAEVKPQEMDSVCPSGEVNKILVKANVMEDTEESLLDSGDSMDLKIVETDSRGSVSNSNHSAETRDSKKDDRSRSSSHSHRSRSHHHQDHHRSSSSSTSQHKSSHNKAGEKEQSRHRSREHKTSSDKSRSGKKESSRKQPRDNKDKEKEKSKEKKKNGDSCRDRSERRSTDRDSNDGTNSGSQSKNVGEKTATAATTTKPSTDNNQKTSPASPKNVREKSSTLKSPVASELNPTVSLDRNDVTDRLQKPIVVDQFLDGKELNLIMRAATPTTIDAKVGKKPRIAASSKIRKVTDEEVQLKKGPEPVVHEDGEESPLLYFPIEEGAPTKFGPSVSEKWWKRVKENNEEQELVKEVLMFCEETLRGKRKPFEEPKGPSAKTSKIEANSASLTVGSPINGLRKAPVAATATSTATDFVDMDDYHEAEIDLDDLAAVPLTENNNVQKENKNYGLSFNKLGGFNGK